MSDMNVMSLSDMGSDVAVDFVYIIWTYIVYRLQDQRKISTLQMERV